MSTQEFNSTGVTVTPATPENNSQPMEFNEKSEWQDLVNGVVPKEKEQPKPPRRATPAHTTYLSTLKYNGYTSSGNVAPLNDVPENEIISDDDVWDDNSLPVREMSAAAQAATLSAFLSLSTSDSDESQTESHTRITDVYHDPMDLVGIEDLVLGILKTGKLSIHGEPGDMSKIQPALFALQASEKELHQLIPQLMQSPFFYQDEQVQEREWNNSESCLPLGANEMLELGYIRIGVPIDTAIYTLLRSFCAKTAKQAEAIITTLMTTHYIPAHSYVVLPQMPPILFQSIMAKPRQMARLTFPLKRMNGESSISPGGTEVTATLEMPQSHDNKVSGSSLSSSEFSTTTTSEASKSASSLLSDWTSSGSLRVNTGLDEVLSDTSIMERNGEKQPQCSPTIGAKPSSLSQKAKRKMSKALKRPFGRLSSSSDFSDFEGSIDKRRIIPDQSTWNTSIVDNNMVVSQYGDTSYPLLMWNPKLKMDLQLKSSIGLLCGTVTGVDPAKPIVSLKLVNNTSSRVAFSIRSYHQSTMYTSHVVYPTKGLHIIDMDQCWEDNVEFYPNVKGKSEMFVIDLFVCTMGDQPSWNIMRRYAAMRGVPLNSGSTLSTRRLSKKRASLFYMPGSKDQKEDNLKVLISHGLQCVVKGKLDEAEVIFTHALLLPDFQRIQLKAFVYICLAVVANKRQSKGHYDGLLPVLHQVTAANQLVDAVESIPGSVKMPRMMQLVKQLRKELDVRKLFTEHRQKSDGRKTPKLDDLQMKESENITQEGGTVSCNATTVSIPQNALRENTRITLSMPDLNQLDAMLCTTGWDKTVKIITAVHISCNPITENFTHPITLRTVLPKDAQPNPHCIRLVQSNYLRHWQDITDDAFSSVKIEGDNVLITTDRSGWLAVTTVQFDPSAIILKAMRSLSVEPVMLRFSVYGLNVPDTRILQIAVFVSPKSSQDEKPQHHVPIAFPHTVEAYPGERLHLSFQGQIEPETSMNEKDLFHDFDVQQNHTSICEKWLRMTTPPDRPLSGKVVVSSRRNSLGGWESIAEILLLANTGFASATNTSQSASSGSEI